MELKLTRPICFFDLETTGIDIGKALRLMEMYFNEKLEENGN